MTLYRGVATDSAPVDEAQASFGDFVRSRRAGLVAAAAVVIGNADEAEDMVQEALIKVAARWYTLQHQNPTAYARQIVLRDAVSRWRRTARRRRVEHLLLNSDRAQGAAHPDRTADEKIMVQQLMQQLSARQRAVLFLRYFADMTEEDIARTLGISRGSVKRHAHLGMVRLRHEYELIAAEGVHHEQ